MAGYAARTNGSVVYDEQGSDDPLVLLHGGAVDARSFEQNVEGLAIVPGTSHFLLQEKAALCNPIVLDLLLHDPAATVAPVRRAQPQPVS